jgi:hypothetical protein
VFFKSYLSQFQIRLLTQKLHLNGEKDLEVPANEFVRFALIASECPGLFFPCSRFIDDIWHICILETAEYRDFCTRIKAGFFLDHSGVTFDDHAVNRSADSLISEDVSILVSYVHNFGCFTNESIFYWPIAERLAFLDENGLIGLNRQLTNISKSKGQFKV